MKCFAQNNFRLIFIVKLYASLIRNLIQTMDLRLFQVYLETYCFVIKIAIIALLSIPAEQVHFLITNTMNNSDFFELVIPIGKWVSQKGCFSNGSRYVRTYTRGKNDNLDVINGRDTPFYLCV